MSILAFGDLHLGLKSSYSSQLESGFVSSEEEAIKCMNHIYQRSLRDDIGMIIFTGDLTHTNHPTSLVVSQIINWLIQMDKLNKPFYLITGNHDLSTYSHSFDFIKPMIKDGLLKNIIVVDENTKNIKYNNRDLVFIPFVWGEATDKYSTVQETIKGILADKDTNSDLLIISHFQESDSQSGSETAMISKSTEKFDLDESEDTYTNVTFLLGHIHQYQQYTKRNGINVCYTGNPYYHDKTDCNKAKGYVIIDNEFNITFEAIPNLTKFYKYSIPSEIDPELFFEKTRMFPKSVAYVENNISKETESISDHALSKILSKYNVILASVKNIIAEQSVDIKTVFASNSNFRTILNNTTKHNYSDLEQEKQDLIIKCGNDLLTLAGYQQ